MKTESIWKKLILLTFAAIFALHVNVVSANDDTSTITADTTESGDEECVITEDLQ